MTAQTAETAINDAEEGLPLVLAYAERLLGGTRSTKQRMRVIWGASKQAAEIAADKTIEAEFLAIARRCGLIDARGYYVASDVRDSVRCYGAEDLRHVINWGLRGLNPFERGPLK